MRKIPKPDAATFKALLPYGMIGLLATKLGQAYRLATGADIIDRLMNARHRHMDVRQVGVQGWDRHFRYQSYL